MNACAITDHGNLYGAIEFYTECKEGGHQPGHRLRGLPRPRHRGRRRRPASQGDAYTHLTLLAKNAAGFKNLIKLSQHRLPRRLLLQPADRPRDARGPQRGADLPERLPGRGVQPAHPQGPAEGGREARQVVRQGCSRRTSTSRSRTTASACRTSARRSPSDIADKLGVPLVATADAHYLCADDADRPRRALLHQHRQEARPAARRQYPEETDAEPVLRPQPGGHVQAVPRTTRTPSPAARRSPTGSTSSSTSRSGTSRSSSRPPGKTAGRVPARAVRPKGSSERYGDDPTQAVCDRLEHELGIISQDGLRQLLPDRLGLRAVRPGEGIPSTARGSGCGAIVALRAVPQPRLPARVRPAVRAVPRPEPERGAGHRHRLLPGPPRARHPVREGEVRRTTRWPRSARSARWPRRPRSRTWAGCSTSRWSGSTSLCKLVPMKGAIAAGPEGGDGSRRTSSREYDTDPQVRQLVDIALKLEGIEPQRRHARGRGGDRQRADHRLRAGAAGGPQGGRRRRGQGGNGEVVVTTQWEMGILEKVGMLKMDFLGPAQPHGARQLREAHQADPRRSTSTR